MSQTHVQPFPQPLGPVATRWWQRPVVAIATVVVVTGLTGGIAYAATRGDTGGNTQSEVQFPGGGQFPGGQMGQQGQMPGGVPGQTSRGANSPTT